MALSASLQYFKAVALPHKAAVRISVLHDGLDVTPEGGIPVIDGDVSMSFSSRVTRSLNLQVPFEYFPHAADDLLSPYIAVVKVEAGIEYLDGSQELFPVFTGRVYEASLSGEGGVTIRADDLAADVIAFRFEQPFSVPANFSAINAVEILIADAINNPSFGPHDARDTLIPASLTWDEDRGQALDDLAAAVSSRWYTLGNGSFVVRELPYLEDEPAFYLVDGEGGVLGDATKTITRDATANSITVTAERLDGTDPIVYHWRDTTPGSPTRFGGPFGKVSQLLRPQTPLTFAQANQLARSQLAASLALTEQWTLSAPAIHVLEPGDQVHISYRGVEADQIIDSLTLPLTPYSAMSIHTRGTVAEPSGEAS